MHITIQRSRVVTVWVDGLNLETRTQSAIVGALLTHMDIALMGLDYTIPRETTDITSGMLVRVIRVREEIISEISDTAFDNTFQSDPSLALDEKRVVQVGRKGLRRKDIRIRYENDIEVTRTVEGHVTVQEVQNQITHYGSGIFIRVIQTSEGSREYWRKIRMLTTSYHPAALGGDDITATGRRLTKGIVAVDPTIIPYGSEVYVPGYGIGLVADTGGPRSTRRWIDLGYDDDNWVSWSQYTDVYLLTPIPDDVLYVLPD